MKSAAQYREDALRFRALANETDEATAKALLLLAAEYEALADEMEPRPPMPNAG